eukprot:CAMPEP_0171183628 /NCGR_PEP_ID=MMETSP0790-20130122/15376_1 /TAXON_ID=2925 /ORGANISM="Alexandrium catenella, Strain OF101" /LENGTH=116 /DNA_ID=CAMNT_0011648609 /DNA_START=82 /DNA_END=433 /DNA_ORIENTATION=+
MGRLMFLSALLFALATAQKLEPECDGDDVCVPVASKGNSIVQARKRGSAVGNIGVLSEDEDEDEVPQELGQVKAGKVKGGKAKAAQNAKKAARCKAQAGARGGEEERASKRSFIAA